MSNAHIKNMKVGDCITERMYSDSHSYTITKVMPSYVMAVRNKEHIDLVNWKPDIQVGGFAGHCSNQHSQKWIIEGPHPDAKPERFTVNRSKAVPKWVGLLKKNSKYPNVSEGAHPFYDYNF